MLITCALYSACKPDGPYEACTLMHRYMLHIHTDRDMHLLGRPPPPPSSVTDR